MGDRTPTAIEPPQSIVCDTDRLNRMAGETEKQRERTMAIAYHALWALREEDDSGAEPLAFKQTRIELRRRLAPEDPAVGSHPQALQNRSRLQLIQ